MNTETVKTESKTVEPKKERPKPKPVVKPIEVGDIADVHRLFKRSIQEFPWSYPVLDPDQTEEMMSELYRFISSPLFFGLIARVGKRPVAMILGEVGTRPLGQPRHYMFILSFYVDKEYRMSGVMKAMINDFFAKCRSKGIRHWEANVHTEELEKFLTGYQKLQVLRRYSRLGGHT